MLEMGLPIAKRSSKLMTITPSSEQGQLTFARRHLLRLWLRDPENAWQTPEVLQPRWDQIYRGVTPETSVFPLEPFVRSAGNKGRYPTKAILEPVKFPQGWLHQE